MAEAEYSKNGPLATEYEAWNFLDWLKDHPQDLPIRQLELGTPNWARLSVHYEGLRQPSSLTPAMMEAMLALQSAIYRSFAIVKYNDERASVLSDKDKQAVEIVVNVSDGSTGIEVDGTSIANHIIDAVGSKMSGTEVLTCAVLAIILFFGAQGLKLVLAHRKAVRVREIEREERSTERLEEVRRTVALSREETRRLEIVETIVSRNKGAASIEREVGKAVEATLKSASEVAHTSIQGLEITGPVAEDLISAPRSSAESIILDGVYRILSVDGSQEEDFRARLENNENQERISASLQDALVRGTEGEVVQEAF